MNGAHTITPFTKIEPIKDEVVQFSQNQVVHLHHSGAPKSISASLWVSYLNGPSMNFWSLICFFLDYLSTSQIWRFINFSTDHVHRHDDVDLSLSIVMFWDPAWEFIDIAKRITNFVTISAFS